MNTNKQADTVNLLVLRKKISLFKQRNETDMYSPSPRELRVQKFGLNSSPLRERMGEGEFS